MKIFCMGKPVMKRLKSTTAVALSPACYTPRRTRYLPAQQYIARRWQAVAAVITDPRTGGVLSLVSMLLRLNRDGISSAITWA